MDITKIINSSNKISVDLDGVLLALFLNRVWMGDPFDKNGVKPSKKNKLWRTLCVLFEDPVQHIAQRFRVTMPFAYSVLDGWKKQGKTLYLVTARKTHVKKATYWWLKKSGYLTIFDEIFMNNTYKRASEYKYDVLEKIQPDIHIDDDPVVIAHLAESYPDKHFIHMNSSKYIPNKNENISVVRGWGELLGY